MDIDNPKHTLRLYKALCFEHERRTHLALKSLPEGIRIGALFSGLTAMASLSVVRPLYVAPFTVADKVVYALFSAAPFVISLISAWRDRRHLTRSLQAPVFYLVFGRIEAIVPTGEFITGWRGGGGARILFHYVLSQALPATLGPGGMLDRQPALARHSIAAKSLDFYTHEARPNLNSDVIFLCDKTWRYGLPFKFDMLESMVLARKQRRS